MKVIMSTEYKTFFKEIKERIHKAQYDAFKAVNKELIALYWDIINSGKAGYAWVGQGSCGDTCKRPAKRVSGDTRVFQRKSLENAKILSHISFE